SFDSQYYLETTVNGAVLSPRQPLTAAPYALTAKSLPGVTVSNGNVGIGTTEPGGKLHVDMDGAGTTWEVVFKDGNVGIGTTEPTAKLDVWGDYVAIRADESRHKAFVMEDISTNKRWYLSHRNITGENKFMLIYTPDNGMTWQFPLTVLTNNNVGIGTLTPSRRLSVAGTIEITSGSGGQLKFADGSLQTTAAGAGASSWAVSGNNISNTNTGNVGIGAAAPDHKLDVRGATAADTALAQFLYLDNDAGGTRPRLRILGSANKINLRTTYGTGGAADLVLGTNAAENAIYIKESGDVGIGTATPSENLVVGEDTVTNLLGNRITIGNSTGESGINLGENQQNRAFILWKDQLDALQLGTIRGGVTTGSYVYLKDGKMVIGVADLPEELTASKLIVAGTIESTSGGIKFPDGTIQTTEAGAGAASWGISGNNIYNTNAGNVGIGTSAPQSPLYVVGSPEAGNDSVLRVINNQTNGKNYLEAAGTNLNNGGLKVWDGTSVSYLGWSKPAQEWQIYAGGGDSPDVKMVIEKTGNVGIGTVAPGGILDLAGKTTFEAGGGMRTIKSVTAEAFYKLDGTQIGAGLDQATADGRYVNISGDTMDGTLTTEGSAHFATLGGNVGIGTTTPEASLHVVGNNVKFVGSFEAGRNATASGQYSVAMGSSTASGQYSIAAGNGSGASAWGSVAMGDGASAPGTSSTAMGQLVLASGTSSTALGAWTRAEGSYSTAIGFRTTASNQNSTAMGLFTTANGPYSTAMGSSVEVSGNFSFGIGLDNIKRTVLQSNTMAILGGSVGIGTATPGAKLQVAGTVDATAYYLNGSPLSFSTADITSGLIGGTTIINTTGPITTTSSVTANSYYGDGSNLTGVVTTAALANYVQRSGDTMTGNLKIIGSLEVGTGSATGFQSVAMGNAVVASGQNSIALGYRTTASSVASTALGSNTIASGDTSTALGENAKASNRFSTAMGDSTIASGIASTAMGTRTTASGNYSTALGFLTSAESNYSTAMGGNTTASGNYSTALGGYTTASGNYSVALGSHISVNADNSVGIGLDNLPRAVTQSNTMAVMGGKVGIGTTDPGGILDLAGKTTFEAGGGMRTTGKVTAEAFYKLDGTEIGGIGGGGTAGKIAKFSDSTALADSVITESGGNVGIGNTGPSYTLEVNGSFAATYKNFDIPHPLDPNKRLVHSSIEGPEHAVYYRGEAALNNGEAAIILPDYFEALTRKEGRTVILTNVDGFDRLAVKTRGGRQITDGRFTVYSDNPSSAQKFNWEVKAIRADIPDLVTEK
ncbi:hypothetical protein A2625_04360, partial [candidate division WOR-1 bacterium RIFCSPHIGHO2_01_FULL_53_15]